jgi:hypothetical protein
MAYDVARSLNRDINAFRPVHRRREFVRVLGAAGCAMCPADAFAQLAHALFEQRLDFGRVAAGVAFDDNLGGDGVAYAVGDELRAGDDGGMLGVHHDHKTNKDLRAAKPVSP